MAGYSGTPFQKRLGIKERTRVALRDGRSYRLLADHRVITRARLYLVALLFGLDLNLAKGPIALGIRGGIPDVVLTAQFLRNLVEGLFEFFELVSYFNDAPARLGGQLFHL